METRRNLRVRSLSLSLAAAVALGAVATHAHAGDYAWDGSVNSDWWGAARDKYGNILDTNWTPANWPGNADNALIAKSGVVNFWSGVALNSLTISDPNAVLIVQGGRDYAPANLGATTISNHGTINLENAFSNYGNVLSIGAGGMTNYGSLNTNAGTGGNRSITGTLLNVASGSVNIGTETYFSGATANHGTYNVAAGAFCQYQVGSSFNQNAGSLSIGDNGILRLDRSTFNYTGGAVSGTIELLNSTLTTTSDGTGQPVFHAYATSRLSGNLSTGVTVNVHGGGWSTSAVFIVDDGASSSGTITLENSFSNYLTRLQVKDDASGTFTNHGTINSNPGTGGDRQINGNLISDGTINLNTPTTFYGNLTNSGKIVVAPGIGVGMPVGYALNQNAGSLSLGEGASLVLDRATFNYNGGTATGFFRLLNSTLSTSTANGNAAVFNTYASSRLAGNLAPNTTVIVSGGGWSTSAVLTTDQVASNAGTITLQNEYSNYGSSLTIGDGAGTLTNTGIINSNPGTGGPRYITGNLINQGSVNINQPTAFYGSVTNSSSFTIAQDSNASLPPSGSTFNQNAGALSIGENAFLRVDQGTFNFNGGSITGLVQLLNSSLSTSTPDGHDATLNLYINNHLVGNLSPKTTLWVSGGGWTNSATLTVDDQASSSGTINLQNVYSNYGSFLTIGPEGKGTFTNKGAINSNPGTGGPRQITGNLINQGSVNVNQPTTFVGSVSNSGDFSVAEAQSASFAEGSTFTQTAGTAAVAKDAALFFDRATLNFNGGKITGLVQLLNSTLSTSTTDGKGAVFNVYAGSRLAGNLATNTTVLVSGGGWYTSAVLTTDQVASNAGTITLQSVYSTYGSFLTVGDGAGTLTNTGTINSDPGTGGPRQITGNLVNSGTININQPTTLAGNVTNTGTFTVADSQSAYIPAGKTFKQSAGILTVSPSASLTLDQATFDYSGGAMIGPVTLVNSKLKTASSDGHGGTFHFEASNTLQTDLAPGSTIWIRGGARYTSAHAYTPQSTTNSGTITLEDVYSNYGSFLHIGDDSGTLRNKGIINSNPGTGGPRTIYGHVINDGDLNIRINTSITGSLINNANLNLLAGTLSTPSITNTGTMYIHPGSNFSTAIFNNTGTLSYAGSHSWAPGSVLNVAAGIVDLQNNTGAPGQHNLTVNVATGATAHFRSTQHLAALNLNGGTATMQPGSKSVLVTKSLAIAPPATLDICDNAMIVRAESTPREQALQQVVDLVKSGRAEGTWTGQGITSCVAAADQRQMTALAVILNDALDGTGAVRDELAGESVDTNCILVKFTWNGDANLDGLVNADDYFLIDSGYITQKGGWYNGDFNYDDIVNADDYFLIDSAFIGQTSTLAAAVKRPCAAVPEAGSMSLLLAGSLSLALRRRRRV